MSKEELKTLHDLHKQKHLVTQRTDKGSTVVITEENHYINKLNKITSDTRKFELLNIEEDKEISFLKVKKMLLI